jgi:helix-turn-helix protein
MTRKTAPPTPDDLPKLLTVAEVAEKLALSRGAVYELCQWGEENGGLFAFRFRCRTLGSKRASPRGAIRVPVESVQRFLERSRIR